jgi:pimeloyl-ACP methyl ester carboxylesterase
MDNENYNDETVWKFLSRLCRLMCGGGSTPPKAVPNQSGARPLIRGVAPDSISSCRKGEALPHIGRRSRKPLCILFLLLTCGDLSAQNLFEQNQDHRVRNIVLVHGAWADGSGWKGVYDILVKDGYNVRLVQAPETSFKEDVAATKRVLAQLDGPCILVAHSYGGAVVLNAADNFKAVITTPAWRSKPSWVLVAAKDRTINPDLERWYAARANSHKVEVSGASHAVYISKPKEVAAVIEEAASHARR